MSQATLADLETVVVDARAHWRAPRRLALSDWADQHFVLPEGDPNAGRWRTLPYQRAIMDAISDPAIERVTVMKSARIGWTKICDATIGYFIQHDASPIMAVQPTLDDARKYSREDIAPLLRDVPILRGLVAEPKTRDSGNTILDKVFRGGSLSLIGANSPRGFRRTSRRVLIFDEIDGYPPSAGTEGDQIELGIRRTEHYWNRKILLGSTPTVKGVSRIHRAFLDGDQRRYYVPCPHCGAFQVLKPDNLKWPEGQPFNAAFICEAKGCRIEHRHKRDMVAAGRWQADAPDNWTPEHRHASFHIWAAYSFSPNATWGQIASEQLAAVAGGPLTHQVFKNGVLGEPWEMQGEAPAWEPLLQRRESYRVGVVPEGVVFLTAGVDVQKDRVVVEVVGWGFGKQSWSIEYRVIPGDSSDVESGDGPWIAVDKMLAAIYPTAWGGTLSLKGMGVDSGWNTTQIYAWSRRHPLSRVFLLKGMARGARPILPPSAVDVNPRGKQLKGGARVWGLVGSHYKHELYTFLRLTDPAAPGYCHFPEYGEDYFKELTAEQLVTRVGRTGFPRLEWELIPGRRNEALDCRIYARFAAQLVGLERVTPQSVPKPTVYDDEVPG